MASLTDKPRIADMYRDRDQACAASPAVPHLALARDRLTSLLDGLLSAGQKLREAEARLAMTLQGPQPCKDDTAKGTGRPFADMPLLEQVGLAEALLSDVHKGIDSLGRHV